MGGYNSGPYGYFGKTAKPTTSASYGIDIRRLKRDGLLAPGRSFGWKWTKKDGDTASVGINVQSEDTLQISYTVTQDGITTPMSVIIHLDFTKCNYGGKRYWFHCPDCFERVAWLYIRGVQFKCRRCHQITYRSCQESGHPTNEQEGRVNRLLTKLKSKKVYGFDLIYHTPQKPKGMHLKTYHRLLEEFEEEQLKYMAALNNQFTSLTKRLSS